MTADGQKVFSPPRNTSPAKTKITQAPISSSGKKATRSPLSPPVPKAMPPPAILQPTPSMNTGTRPARRTVALSRSVAAGGLPRLTAPSTSSLRASSTAPKNQPTGLRMPRTSTLLAPARRRTSSPPSSPPSPGPGSPVTPFFAASAPSSNPNSSPPILPVGASTSPIRPSTPSTNSIPPATRLPAGETTARRVLGKPDLLTSRWHGRSSPSSGNLYVPI